MPFLVEKEDASVTAPVTAILSLRLLHPDPLQWLPDPSLSLLQPLPSSLLFSISSPPPRTCFGHLGEAVQILPPVPCWGQTPGRQRPSAGQSLLWAPRNREKYTHRYRGTPGHSWGWGSHCSRAKGLLRGDPQPQWCHPRLGTPPGTAAKAPARRWDGALIPEIPFKVVKKKQHREAPGAAWLTQPWRFHQRFQPQAPSGLAVGRYLITVKCS